MVAVRTKITSWIYCVGVFAVSSLGQPGLDGREAELVKAKTPVWENARDLLVMFESADDRTVLADAVVSACITSSTLSDPQRYDGLRVAGNALFRDREFTKAVSAFEQAVNHTELHHEKAVVLAGAAGTYLTGLNQPAVALTKYQQAADAYLQSDPTQIGSMAAESVFRRLVGLSADQAEHALSLQYAKDAISLSATLTHSGLDLGFYKHAAALAAQRLGDMQQASLYYTLFLEDHPGYLNNQPRLGIIPSAKIQKALVEGSTWDKPDETLINLVLEIVRDADYLLMPIRVNSAEKLAFAWDNLFAFDASMALRSEVAKSTFPAIETLDSDNSSEAMLGRQLWLQVATSQFNGAFVMFHRRKDTVGALKFLNRILAPSDFASPDLVASAESLKAEILAVP